MDIEKGIQLINVDDIIPNRFQPRLAFKEEELKELSDSIKQHGVIQPLVLRQIGDKYEIIAGERRYKASCLAGLTQVPAVIMNVDDGKSAEIAVVENIQRKDLTAIEEAQSYKKLLEKGMTQDELATKLGISQASIANKIRLLALSDEVQQALLLGRISERHARSLLQITDKEEQIRLLNKITEERLTVKQTDELINKIIGKVVVATDPLRQEEIKPIEEKKEDIFNMNIEPITQQNVPEVTNDFVNNNIDNTVKSFEDLMKKQEPLSPLEVKNESEEASYVPKVEPPRPINLESQTEELIDTPEILDFDSKSPLENEIISTTQEDYNPPVYESPTIETPNQIIEEFKTQKEAEIEVEAPMPVGNTLADAISSARGLKDNLLSKGFRVNTEEFDFEDMYQIVIKIQKD